MGALVLPHEKLYLEHLPDADRYYKSFMHRDQINFVTMTKWVLAGWHCACHSPAHTPFRNASTSPARTNFLITTSLDHLKFWKKQDAAIEFAKHYRASLSAVVGVAASPDGRYFASVSAGGEGRVFDVVNVGACGRAAGVKRRKEGTAERERARRHDQHSQICVQAEMLLLGTRGVLGAESAGRVSPGVWRRRALVVQRNNR